MSPPASRTVRSASARLGRHVGSRLELGDAGSEGQRLFLEMSYFSSAGRTTRETLQLKQKTKGAAEDFLFETAAEKATLGLSSVD